MIKVAKEDIYVKLAEKYGYTFDEIADMNPYQQYVAFRGPRIVTIDSIDDVRTIQERFRR